MALIWRNTMSVGNDVIDNDHKYLICYINTVELALQKPEEGDVLLSSLTQLYSYAYEHFTREEIIQRKIGYPQYKEHHKEHMDLLEQLSELKNKIKQNYSKDDIEKRYDELVSFLRHWLIDHVLNDDMLLKPYLAKHPKTLS